VPRHLFADRTAVLHAGQLGREDHDGDDNPHVSHHIPAAGRRYQPLDVAGDAADRQISAVHDVPRHVLDRRDGPRAEHPPALGQHSRHVAVRRGTVPQGSASSAVHAETPAQRPVRQQIHEGELSADYVQRSARNVGYATNARQYASEYAVNAGKIRNKCNNASDAAAKTQG